MSDAYTIKREGNGERMVYGPDGEPALSHGLVTPTGARYAADLLNKGYRAGLEAGRREGRKAGTLPPAAPAPACGAAAT